MHGRINGHLHAGLRQEPHPAQSQQKATTCRQDTHHSNTTPDQHGPCIAGYHSSFQGPLIACVFASSKLPVRRTRVLLTAAYYPSAALPLPPPLINSGPISRPLPMSFRPCSSIMRCNRNVISERQQGTILSALHG